MSPSVRTKTRFLPMNPGQRRSATIRACTSCGVQQSAAWRVGENDERLCNKCGLRWMRLKKSGETSRRQRIGGRSFEATNLLHDDFKEGFVSQPMPLNDRDRDTWMLPIEPLPRLLQVFPQSDCEKDEAELSTRRISHLFEPPSAVMFVVIHAGVKSASKQRGMSKSTLNNLNTSVLYDDANIAATMSSLCPVFDRTSFEGLRLSFESPLRTFFWHCAGVHQEAISRQSSIYAATEIFICEHAGESTVLTAFAVLREQYDSTPSPAAQHLSWSGFRAAQDDLEFGFAITGHASDMQSLRNYLHHQYLSNYISSERTKRSLWDLGRMSTGPHIQDSETYVWYKRTFMEPGSGINTAPASDHEEFRRMHRVLIMKNNRKPSSCIPELLSVVEHELREACITTCQEWFIAVLDESSKIPVEKQQLSFIEANRRYMLSSIEGLIHALVKMNVKRPMHICSFDCLASNPQLASLGFWDLGGGSDLTPDHGLCNNVVLESTTAVSVLLTPYFLFLCISTVVVVISYGDVLGLTKLRRWQEHRSAWTLYSVGQLHRQVAEQQCGRLHRAEPSTQWPNLSSGPASGFEVMEKNGSMYLASRMARSRHWAFDRHQAMLLANNMPDKFYPKRDARRFIELLHAPHSTLPSSIQCLLLQGPDMGHEVPDVTGPQRYYDVLDALISEHLPLLSNLRSITIAALTWRCLRPESKALIGSLAQVTSVTWFSVVFDRLHDLFGFCSTNFSHLKILKIRSIRVTDLESQDASPPPLSPSLCRGFPRLRLLDLQVDDDTVSLLSVLSMYVPPQDIDTLCLASLSTNHMPLARHFIEAVGPNLRHVALGITDPTAASSESISFHANPNLRSVEISAIDLHPSLPCDSAWLEALLATITARSFEDLTIWFNATWTARLDGVDFHSLERHLLQRVLDRRELQLPVVHAKFLQTGAWKEADNAGLVAAVEGHLPELHKRGLLAVYPQGQPLSKVVDEWWPYSW